MDITISGDISIRFAPELKENMSTQELVDAHVFGYIEEAFKNGDCVADSFNYNVKDIDDYREILDSFDIIDEEDFEGFFVEYIADYFINEYFDKEYIFKRTEFDEIDDIDALEIRFDVDLCITLEQLCQKYVDSMEE